MFKFERTPQFDLSKYRYVAETPTLEAETLRCLYFKPDGTRLFYMGATGGILRSYDMSTPWDIRTITNPLSSSARLVDTGSANIVPSAMTFNSNGTVLLVGDQNVGGPLYKYDLSTGWNVTSINTTASQQILDINVSGASGLALGNNDNTIALTNFQISQVKIFSISSSLDLNTMTLQHITLGLGSARTGISFVDNGNKACISSTAGGFSTVAICQATSTPYGALNTATLSFATVINNRPLGNLVFANGMGDSWMSNDGNYLYIISSAAGFVYRKIFMFSTLYPPFLNL